MMKVVINNIFAFLKHTAFIVVLFSMVAQPILQSISYLIDNDIKLTQLDWEEDTDEEEKKEDNKEEKIEFQIPTTNNRYSDYSLKHSNYYPRQETIYDFSLEIVSPPPKYF